MYVLKLIDIEIDLSYIAESRTKMTRRTRRQGTPEEAEGEMIRTRSHKAQDQDSNS